MTALPTEVSQSSTPTWSTIPSLRRCGIKVAAEKGIKVKGIGIKVSSEKGGDTAAIRAACCELLPRFIDENTVVTPVEGGISNLLYLVRSEHHAPVLCRVYGEGGSIVIDRDIENEVFQELADLGFGPQLLGHFGNGRLEQFLEGTKCLEPSEMVQTADPDYASAIAQQLRSLHSLDIKCTERRPVLWTVLDSWYKMASDLKFEGTKAKALQELDFAAIAEDLVWLRDAMPSDKNGNGQELLQDFEGEERRALEIMWQTVFCHNDLLGGNILYNAETAKMTLIDYEYANYNCRAFDIANHFAAIPESFLIQEGSFNVDKWYPGDKFQADWLRAYFGGDGEAKSDEFIRHCIRAVGRFVLLPELHWILWAVVQAYYSPVDFDYAGYAVQRYRQAYLRYRQRYFPERAQEKRAD